LAQGDETKISFNHQDLKVNLLFKAPTHVCRQKTILIPLLKPVAALPLPGTTPNAVAADE